MKTIAHHDALVLRNFIEQNWSRFLAFCDDEHGMSEADCDKLADDLGKEE